MVLAVLGFIVIGSVVYVVGLYNGLISLKHAMDQAWANIDVLLKQRHDELPKLMDTVKGYMGHEREVLERVTAARTAYQQAQTMEQKGVADEAVRSALGRLFAVAESYPQLKADASFRMLQERISSLEEEIADRREFFNHSVNAFNVRIEQLPDVFLARMMGLTTHALFRVSEEDKQDVQIRFQ
ncbi:MAG TPA: LemA family protein [Myxococcota bacterium]|nr:LemA family protein [Myxococcota bacterium]